MFTSCSLPDSEFATPLWRRGTLGAGVEMRANAERLSPVGEIMSALERRSNAGRLEGGVPDCPPEGLEVSCGELSGEVILSLGGHGDGVCET